MDESYKAIKLVNADTIYVTFKGKTGTEIFW